MYEEKQNKAGCVVCLFELMLYVPAKVMLGRCLHFCDLISK